MLTVKGCYGGRDEWNKEAEMLVRSLEETIQGFNRIVRADKENIVGRASGKDEGRARSAVKEWGKGVGVDAGNKKADPLTVGILINKGIYNLRKMGSPSPGYLTPCLKDLAAVKKDGKKGKTGGKKVKKLRLGSKKGRNEL